MIPKQSNCNPPTNKKILTIEGHPDVGSPKIKVLITIKIKAIREPKQESAPINEAIFKGVSEKLTMPSIEYWNNFQNDQDVSPATLSRFS